MNHGRLFLLDKKLFGVEAPVSINIKAFGYKLLHFFYHAQISDKKLFGFDAPAPGESSLLNIPKAFG